MAEALLRCHGLVKRFGGLTATDNLDLTVASGEIHAVIGPNGAGKTTLVGLLSGELATDAGEIHFAGRDITRLPIHGRSARGLSRSFQITSIFNDLTVLENVVLAIQAHLGHSFRFWQPALADAALTVPARAQLAEVGLADRADLPAAQLSHGEKRSLEIAMALATKPLLVLLDEPLAGMGLEDSARIIKFLAQLKRRFTFLLIEHDMGAVFSLADRITVMVYGRVIATGTPLEIRDNPQVREAYLGQEAVA